ncbi:hypothetical protein M3Y97_00603500 [Aphelenchoides bicaudatus]|nr:hypothetical protein M3Y97_00603500 [Aphelenchoides bicaudatus]
MCTTLILKPIFIITVVIALGLTAASLFTPGWRSIKNVQDTRLGILTYSCGSNSTSNSLDVDSCKNFWDSRPGWEKAVIVLMFVALILEVVIIVWSVVSCLCFCFPACFLLVTLVTALATICLVVAVSLYGGKNSESIGDLPNSTKDFTQLSNVGYSFWLGVAAAVVMCFATLFGSVTALISSITPF